MLVKLFALIRPWRLRSKSALVATGRLNPSLDAVVVWAPPGRWSSHDSRPQLGHGIGSSTTQASATVIATLRRARCRNARRDSLFGQATRGSTSDDRRPTPTTTS